MFYEGNLQSGIALALQESKCVVCFVRDDGEESTKWETHWLAGNERIVDYLQRNAVTLRLQAGSQEAGFLSSFYPVASVPALVMIDQGKVEQTLLSGVEEDAFTPALIGALSRIEQRKRLTHSQPSAAAAAAASSPPTTTSPSTEPAPTAPQDQPASSSTPNDRQARIQALLEERRQRLEADKKAKDAAEKGKQKERAQHREPSSSSTPGKRTAEQTYAQQQKLAKLEAAKEKERIRKLVELDKLERKEREEQRRTLARAEREAAQSQEAEQTAVSSPSRAADRTDGRGCMVQVRLLDGSTMRASFLPEDKPGQALRRWIDGNRTDGDYPYTFKQIMTPAPSRVISDADEKTSLRDLGMTPSASLVLVPIKGVVAAYQGGGAAGLLNNFLAFLGAIFMGVFDALFRLMQNIMGSSADGQQPDQPAASGNARTTSAAKDQSEDTNSGIKIRTLRDQQGEEDHKLYNGNSLDFEPRKDKGPDKGGEHGSQ